MLREVLWFGPEVAVHVRPVLCRVSTPALRGQRSDCQRVLQGSRNAATTPVASSARVLTAVRHCHVTRVTCFLGQVSLAKEILNLRRD